MPRKKKGPRVIDVNNATEMRNLSYSLHVTLDELLAAIEIVGTVYNDVHAHFKISHNPYFHRTRKGPSK